MSGFADLVKYNEIDVNHKTKRNPKFRFRAAVRYVIANQYWLVEMLAAYVRPSDVGLRVRQAVNPTNKDLTFKDKILLNKRTTDRTEDEKRHLYRLFGGLKCFRRYPDEVKSRLAGSLYYKYYGPGRVVVRQGHDAHALYFIIAGDVIVSQLLWDDLVKEEESVTLGVMQPGDIFAEVALLHDIGRSATCTTAGHCELLVLLKEDFKMNLQATVQRLWDRAERAMSQFTYFNHLSVIELREGVIVAKMKSFEEDDIIMGDGTELTHFVYFVLSGTCQIVESMKVYVTKNNREEVYCLHDRCSISTTTSELDFEINHFRAYENKLRLLSMISGAHISSFVKQGLFGEDDDSYFQERSSNDDSLNFIPENLETVFMQVGTLSPGACFNLGENTRDRFIIALERVTCLLLPRLWLEQRDPTSNWPRVRRYLDRNIPSKQELFQTFLTQQKCKKNTKQMIERVVSRSPNKYSNTRHNVPFSTRLMKRSNVF
ncbi:uncharacterized protein LOC105391233 [Plutella xylostella]|uniref:uncharacterized protein LOC105391233 n=1 Tax=Plutella xylostella TaxID=51655 RepID=UPI0020326CC2|nr:uncharacterized protein LOC105391233 [Plutella xylostella]